MLRRKEKLSVRRISPDELFCALCQTGQRGAAMTRATVQGREQSSLCPLPVPAPPSTPFDDLVATTAKQTR